MGNISLTLANSFPLISAAFIIFLGFFVLRKGRRSAVSWLFFATAVVFTIWEIGTFMMFVSRSDAQIIFWDRFVYLAVVFVPAIQYHFSLAATFYTKRRRRLLIAAYSLSVFFLILSQTPYFVEGVFHYRWGVHTKAQLGHHFFLAFFFFYVFAFLSNFLKHLRLVHRPVERHRLVYYVLSFAFLNLVGSLAYLPAYSIPIYPVALISPLGFSIMITYAIVLHGLLDVKLIMRRYFVYFLSIISILIPATIWLYFFRLVIPNYIFFIFLLILVLALSIFSRLKRYYYQLSNRYFFSSLYDVRELIYSLSISLRSSLNSEQIFGPVAEIFNRSFHNKAIAVIAYNGREHHWIIRYNDHFSLGGPAVRLDYAAAARLFIKGKPLTLDKIRENLGPAPSPLLKQLESWEAETVVPIHVKGRLNKLMLFGAKESGEAYNNGDLKVLDVVATEIGISLENALLYEREKRFNKKLQEEIAKATEQLQAQNQELQKLDQAKDEFISVISHQIRTPLTGIRWFTELLLDQKKKIGPEQRDWLEQINASNQRLIRLVNDLLDVSHIETGRKFEIIKKNFNFNDLLREVLKDNVALIKTKKIKIINQAAADLSLEADREKIKQVWENLVSNATKYSPPETTVTIQAESKAERGLVFSIRDQGIGIPAAEQPHLFVKFFRASNAAHSEPDGTGLGLYIAREIVRAHGGEMWLESRENAGSTFSFSLPQQKIKEKIIKVAVPAKAAAQKNKKYEKDPGDRR